MSRLLKTHRSLVKAGLRALEQEGERLTKYKAPFSWVEHEHVLSAAMEWELQGWSTLKAYFDDQRIAESVLMDLRRNLAHLQDSAGKESKTPKLDHRRLGEDHRRMMGTLITACARLKRVAENLDVYDEPSNLPPLSQAEATLVSQDSIRDFNDSLRRSAATQSASTTVEAPQPEDAPLPTRSVFVSHSADDEALATKLVALLTAAMRPPLSKSDILCTSVPGCRLTSGDRTHDRLRIEIENARVFIALITDVSVESEYVLFELGARWAFQGTTIPLLGPGVGFERIPGPFTGNLHALKADTRTDVLQLVGDVAKALGRETQPPDAWNAELEAVVFHPKRSAVAT